MDIPNWGIASILAPLIIGFIIGGVKVFAKVSSLVSSVADLKNTVEINQKDANTKRDEIASTLVETNNKFSVALEKNAEANSKELYRHGLDDDKRFDHFGTQLSIMNEKLVESITLVKLLVDNKIKTGGNTK